MPPDCCHSWGDSAAAGSKRRSVPVASAPRMKSSWLPTKRGSSLPTSISHAIGTPASSSRRCRRRIKSASRCTAAGATPSSIAIAARVPAASPTFHSMGCSLKQPLVMWVVPIFLAPAMRLPTRWGSSAPSGIWNGRVRQLAPTSSGPERWMSMGYQPTPTESLKNAARGPGWWWLDYGL